MSADDLTMPDDVALRTAAELRTIATGLRLTGTVYTAARLTALADTLDPPPLSLREQVLRVITEAWRSTSVTPEQATDRALTTVADALAAQPLAYSGAVGEVVRDADVAFIRPGSAT